MVVVVVGWSSCANVGGGEGKERGGAGAESVWVSGENVAVVGATTRRSAAELQSRTAPARHPHGTRTAPARHPHDARTAHTAMQGAHACGARLRWTRRDRESDGRSAGRGESPLGCAVDAERQRE